MDAMKPLTLWTTSTIQWDALGGRIECALQLLRFRGSSVHGGCGAAGDGSSSVPVCTVSLAARAAGMSGGMYGNSTHQGDKGGALIVSTQGVRDGLLEKLLGNHV